MAAETEDQVSKTSPVVRQLCPPTHRPHALTFSMPYWQSERTMSRFWWRSAAPITR